jgi:hypothetical protein
MLKRELWRIHELFLKFWEELERGVYIFMEPRMDANEREWASFRTDEAGPGISDRKGGLLRERMAWAGSQSLLTSTATNWGRGMQFPGDWLILDCR